MIGAAIGAVAVGAYSSHKQSKAASKAASSQTQAIESQSEISSRQMDMSDEQYEYYKSNYRPMEEDIVANAGISDDEQKEIVSTAGLNTELAFNSADAGRDRTLQRMGVNPNSGAYAESTRKSAITKAVAKSSAENTARSQAEQMDYSQRVAAVGLGKGVMSSSESLMNSASAGYANQASAYGAQAQMYGQGLSNTMQLGMGIAGAAMNANTSNGFDTSKFGKGLMGVM